MEKHWKKGIFKKFAEFIFEIEAFLSRKWAFAAHKRLMIAQWGLAPSPEFMDHHVDLYYQWERYGIPYWLERGIFGNLCLKGGDVLELSSGDGFNAKHFYSVKSKKVIACDFDPGAIATAKRKNKADNVEYLLRDIRYEMPNGKFDNVIWDAAIEHFTPEEINKIIVNIKGRLHKDGIVSGYTIVERDDGALQNDQHEYEFKDMNDLLRFWKPHFKNVRVFETVYDHETHARHNLYFWASDGALPFSEEHPHSINYSRN